MLSPTLPENGSLTCKIPTFIGNIESGDAEKPVFILLKWEIRDGIMLLAKGGTVLFQVPISQLREAHAEHLKNQAPAADIHMKC